MISIVCKHAVNLQSYHDIHDATYNVFVLMFSKISWQILFVLEAAYLNWNNPKHTNASFELMWLHHCTTVFWFHKWIKTFVWVYPRNNCVIIKKQYLKISVRSLNLSRLQQNYSRTWETNYEHIIHFKFNMLDVPKVYRRTNFYIDAGIKNKNNFFFLVDKWSQSHDN